MSTRSLRTEKKERSGEGNRGDYPTPPEKEVEDKKEKDKKEEGLEFVLQLSSTDVDKVFVNGKS